MIREVPGRRPRVDPDAYVDPQAAVIGDVIIEAGASVWPRSSTSRRTIRASSATT